MDANEQINKCKEFIEANYKNELIKNIRQEKNYIEIDFSKLSKFDPELADLLLDEPDEVIKAAELAVEQFDLPEKQIQILFFNLPKTQKMPLNDISDQINKFLSFEGYVIKPSEKYLKCRSTKYECPACGNIINILMLSNEWKEPTKCGCGRKGKFRELTGSRELIKFQRLEILEPMDTAQDKPRKPVKKKVFIAENLTRRHLNEQLQAGQRVIINGFLELEEIRMRNNKVRSNEFRTNIVANNIIPIENSWEAIILKPNQKKKIIEMAKDNALLDEFAQSLAPSFEGYDMIRKSLILQHIGGKRIFDKNGNLEEKEIISVLMSGAPGSGKSYLMKRSLILSPLKNWTTGKGLSGVGLIACIVRDEYGSYSLEVGPIVMSDKGIVGIDEMEKMNKSDYGMLNNVMSEEKTKITKANIDQELRARTAILATSNPIHKKFTDRDSLISQLAPIPRDIIDRFDVIWAMREDIDMDKLEDKYMARHIHNSEKIKQIWSNEEMTNYITYAKRLIPILTIEIAKYFNEKFRKLTGKTISKEKEGDDDKSKSHRLRGDLMRWIYAHSKFIGIGKEDKDDNIKVTKESVDFAFSLMRHSFSLLDLINEQGFVKYEDMEEIPPSTEVNKYYIVKGTIKKLAQVYNNVIPEDKILEEINKTLPKFDMDDFDKEIDKLKRAGEVFEPRNKHFALI